MKTPTFFILLSVLFIFTPAIQSENHSVASWYGGGEKLNKYTANGEVFNSNTLTCASWNHAFNEKLKVTNAINGKSVIVRVNDRGPAKRLGRTIDLTKAAFSKIANPGKGLAFVKIKKI